MEKSRKITQSILGVTLVTLFVLSVPMIAMQFTIEVNWSVTDFIVMGALLFSTGLSYVLIAQYAGNIVYKAAIIMALGSTFLMIWANLAVGLIGSGPNPGNLMYLGVITVGFIGAFLSRFKPAGMERTLYSVALAVVLLAIITLATSMQQLPESSVAKIIGVNTFFAILFGISGLLFRYAALKQSKLIEK